MKKKPSTTRSASRQIQIATNGAYPYDIKAWKRHPTFETITACVVSTYFAIHEGKWGGFELTHVPTGFNVASGFPSVAAARTIAGKLKIKYGLRWNFTDPEQARTLKGARKFIEKARKVA